MEAQWTKHSPTISEAGLINPRDDTVCSLSLLLVHTLAPRSFSLVFLAHMRTWYQKDLQT